MGNWRMLGHAHRGDDKRKVPKMGIKDPRMRVFSKDGWLRGYPAAYEASEQRSMPWRAQNIEKKTSVSNLRWKRLKLSPRNERK